VGGLMWVRQSRRGVLDELLLKRKMEIKLKWNFNKIIVVF
jgi:hypothetical protein